MFKLESPIYPAFGKLVKHVCSQWSGIEQVNPDLLGSIHQ